MRRRASAATGLALAIAVAACGSSSSGSSSAGSTDASSPTTTAATAAGPLQTGSDGCDHAEPAKPASKQYTKPPSPPFAGGTVIFETSCGTIAIRLDDGLGGPVTSAFAGLVTDGFYDRISFHRVVPGFVLQGGDPTGTGGGGPGFTVMQAPPASYVYRAGDVAMAKTETEPAGAAGSQFFVVTSADGAAQLGAPPPLYAVVGHVVDAASRATIARIDALGTGDGPPSAPVYILHARLVRS
jgi:cyclophilin family peptidyl-prolyl cis-trans isomerase